MRFLKALLLGAILFYPATSFADPTVGVSLCPQQKVKIGAVCPFHLELSWPSQEGEYRFALPDLTLENLRVEGEGESNETFQKQGKEWKKRVFRFDLKATQPGKGRIRPFQIHYLNPTSGQGGDLKIDEISLKVVPDRSGLVRVAVFSAVGIAVVTALSIFLVLRSKRHDLQPQAPREPTLEERYLSQFFQTGGQIAHSAKIFRSYLTEKFSIPFKSATNREAMKQMEGKIPPNELKTLKEIFDKLDEISFAQNTASSTRPEQIHREMIRYIEGKKVI